MESGRCLAVPVGNRLADYEEYYELSPAAYDAYPSNRTFSNRRQPGVSSHHQKGIAVGSFIVEFWSRVFDVLGKISLFSVVRRLFPRSVNARFVDFWVLGHLILAFVCVVVVSYLPGHGIAIAIVGYGMLRVFEVATYQLNVLLFDEYRAVKAGKPYHLEGYRRMILLLLHNYGEIIFWLACTYTVMASDFDLKWTNGRDTVIGSIYSSFITMTTFGEFDLAPKSSFAALVLLFHASIGLFMTLLSLARFISLIPPPRTRDVFEMRQMAQGVEPPPAGAGSKARLRK